mmetsp:Transcript_14054/g.24701  ORF Transcript_14054/g.24701 Transcript_14054/m.24701 type:complete len:90 (-) Transcript_14054:65-334(-)
MLLQSYDEKWYDNDVHVVEVDGDLDMNNLEAELERIESRIEGLNAKSENELRDAMIKLKDSPGSDNGTGLLQTIIAMKVREVYEKLTKS